MHYLTFNDIGLVLHIEQFTTTVPSLENIYNKMYQKWKMFHCLEIRKITRKDNKVSFLTVAFVPHIPDFIYRHRIHYHFTNIYFIYSQGYLLWAFKGALFKYSLCICITSKRYGNFLLLTTKVMINNFKKVILWNISGRWPVYV